MNRIMEIGDIDYGPEYWQENLERLKVRIEKEMQREDISVELRAGLGKELAKVEEEIKFLTLDVDDNEGGIETR